MILGKAEIVKWVGDINLIEGFKKSSLNGAGYDLRIGKAYRLLSSAVVREENWVMPEIEELEGEEFVLRPGDYLLCETIEKVNLPSNLVARVLQRSTIFRCGGIILNAVVDPGYQGILTFGIKNVGDQKLTIEKGTRIAQIVFEEVKGETELYDGKYQGGKVV